MTDQEAITRRRAEFVAAFAREDISALSDILADGNVAMPPNRPALRGIAESQTFWREGFAAAESRFSVMPESLDVLGDVAIDRHRWSLDSALRTGGSSVHDEGKAVWIWRRQQDGVWKLAQAIWNSDLPQGGVWSGAGSASCGLTKQDREALRDIIERRWVAAGLARDSAKLAAMCTEDIEYFPPDQPSFAGRAAVRAFFDQFPPMMRFTQSFQDVEGDAKRAVARCRFACTLDASGKTIENTGKFICSFEKQPSGEWLVQHCAFNFDRPMPLAS